MNGTQRITLCGMGGQGIILSAVILGTAAVTCGHQYAVQTQSYGSEARGGQCQAELIISNQPINSPVAEKKDLLVAMFQEAYEKYVHTLDVNGTLVYDTDLVTKLAAPACARCFPVPATQIAVGLGSRMAANMVMLGFICESLHILTRDDLIATVKKTVSPRFEELNLKAVDAGIAYAQAHAAGGAQ